MVFPKPWEVRIEEFEPRPPGPGEVKVEVEASLISGGTELTAYTGSFPPDSAWSEYIKYPFYPGYCGVGRIVEKGDGVEGLEVGDLVAVDTPHASVATAPAGRLIKVPPGVDVEEAAFHTLAAGVMNSVRLAGVGLGTRVTVIGAGLLGQLAVMFSRLSGAFPVTAVDVYQFRLEMARRSGATDTVVYRGALEEVAGRAGGSDVVFEVTGNPDVLPWAIKLVRPLGKLVVLSSPRGPSTIDFHDEVNRPSRIIMGTHFTSQPEVETPYNPWTRRRNTELFFALLQHGLVSVKHLVTHRLHVREVEKAYKALLEERNSTLGVLLRYRP